MNYFNQNYEQTKGAIDGQIKLLLESHCAPFKQLIPQVKYFAIYEKLILKLNEVNYLIKKKLKQTAVIVEPEIATLTFASTTLAC